MVNHGMICIQNHRQDWILSAVSFFVVYTIYECCIWFEVSPCKNSHDNSKKRFERSVVDWSLQFRHGFTVPTIILWTLTVQYRLTLKKKKRSQRFILPATWKTSCKLSPLKASLRLCKITNTTNERTNI